MELAYYRAAGDAEMGRLSPPESVTGFKIKFIGDWTVLQIVSGDLGLLGLTQNNCSLNSLLPKVHR